MVHIVAMRGKVSYKFVEGAYPHARIEAALAQVFGVPPERLKHLRGRVKHLMVLGLPESRPGKGARILYDCDLILRWLMVLLLEDVGVTPAGAVKTIKRAWGRDFDRWMAKAVDPESADNPVYFTLRPQLVGSSWNEDDPPLWIGFRRRFDPKMKEPDNLKVFRESADEEGSWACTRNLTRDLKRLREHLDNPGAGEAGGKLEAKGAEEKP